MLVIGAAVISDIFPVEERGTAMGVFMAIFLLAPPIGSFLGGFLGELFGWRSIYLFLAGIGVMVLILVSILLPETLDKNMTRPKKIFSSLNLLRKREFSSTTFLGLALMGTFYSFFMFFSLILDNHYSISTFYIGVFFTFYGIADSLFVFIGGRLSDLFSRRNIFISGGIIATIGSIMFALMIGESVEFLIISHIIFGIGIGLATTPLITYALESVPESTGAASGIYNFVRFLGAGAVPFGGYFIIKNLSETTLFLFFGVLLFFTTILAFSSTQKHID